MLRFLSPRTTDQPAAAAVAPRDPGYTLTIGNVELPRRTVVTGAAIAAAWSLPLISQAIAAPAHANASNSAAASVPCVSDQGKCVPTAICTCAGQGLVQIETATPAIQTTAAIFGLYGQSVAGMYTAPEASQGVGSAGSIAMNARQFMVSWQNPNPNQQAVVLEWKVDPLTNGCAGGTHWAETQEMLWVGDTSKPKTNPEWMVNLCTGLADFAPAHSAPFWTDYCAQGVTVLGAYGPSKQVMMGTRPGLGYCAPN